MHDDTPNPCGEPGEAVAGDGAPPVEDTRALLRWYHRAANTKVRWTRVVPLLVLIVVGLGTRVESGFATYTPGPVPEAAVSELAEGAPSAGEWRFTTVEVTPISVTRYLWGLAFDDLMIRVNADHASQTRQRGAAQMNVSQETAWAVASDLVAGGDGHVDARPVITSVEAGSPASRAGVRAGDVVVSVDGVAVTASDEVPPLVQRASAAVSLELERDAAPMRVEVTPVRDADEARIGVGLADRPVARARRPRINASGVGGPSAGLVFTLAYLDSLTAGDLSGGRVVAGTGTIEPDGTVGRIDGASLKVEGAVAAGADVFFAPTANAAEAQAAADGRIEVVAVDRVGEALEWLCGHGGESRVCASRSGQGNGPG